MVFELALKNKWKLVRGKKKKERTRKQSRQDTYTLKRVTLRKGIYFENDENFIVFNIEVGRAG